MAADPIDVLEAAYALDADDDEAWLARVTEAMHPFVDHGWGSNGFFFSVGATGVAVGAGHAMAPAPPVEVVRRMHAALPTAVALRMYMDAPPFSRASESLGTSLRRNSIARTELIPLMDVPDAVGVRANSGPRDGVFFAAPCGRVRPAARDAALCSRLASHIGAGLRLRRRLARAGPGVDDADAILTPSGRVEHATGSARAPVVRGALTAATRSIDRARGRLRRAAPDEAVSLWRALVAGQWSLVDSFDHDGRRYVVAHRNQMLDGRAPLAALSDRERQAATLAALGHGNKLIAYDLGVSLSTVSKLLQRAAAKLGVSSRVGLIQVLNSLPAPVPPDDET